MLVTLEQIEIEYDLKVNPDRNSHSTIQKFLDDSKNIGKGREIISNISNRLLPFYDRYI